jgi:hypothetical protein
MRDDGFLQTSDTTRTVFIESIFHCSPQIKIRGSKSGDLGGHIPLESSKVVSHLTHHAEAPRIHEPCVP